MASKLGIAFDVLTNNHRDVADVIDKLGGIGNVLRAMPAMIKILQTVNASNEDDEQPQKVPLQYGDATKAKVTAFQKKHGLDPDGIVGDKTWAKVEQVLAQDPAAKAK
jgi:peptidoglycan hydrolase-like protein with peptidoglycan-binding domain